MSPEQDEIPFLWNRVQRPMCLRNQREPTEQERKVIKISRVLEGEPVSFEGNNETITVIVQQKIQKTHGSEFYSEIGRRKVTRLTTDESQ